MGGRIRKPAVAGQFYSTKSSELRSELNDYFDSWEASGCQDGVQAIISPHAEYVLSGRIAASAYASIAPDTIYDHVFLLGPSHHVYLDRVSIGAGIDQYETPLGYVDVDTALCQQIIDADEMFTFDERAHHKEHSIEVQLPFLQMRLDHLPKIVPILISTHDIAVLQRLAQVLMPYFTPRNLFVVSSDFSHHPVPQVADRIDELTAEAIETGKATNFIEHVHELDRMDIDSLGTCACGSVAIATLLMMCEQKNNVDIRHIEYYNSGESPYGNRWQTVGYQSFVVTQTKDTVIEDMINT